MSPSTFEIEDDDRGRVIDICEGSEMEVNLLLLQFFGGVDMRLFVVAIVCGGLLSDEEEDVDEEDEDDDEGDEDEDEDEGDDDPDEGGVEEVDDDDE